MIQWKEEIIIESNIEKVWSLFFDKNIKKIMDKVEEHTLIEKKEEEVGAKHRQSYREGKRLETYIVETLKYEDLEDKKQKQISFVLGKAFEITLTFTLLKIDDTHTRNLSFPARRLPLQACEGREPNGKGEMNGGWHKPK
ncbi:hypothetical protein, partial [Peribacillus butanolivorans]|uniref:hypothetical protein n=1 Tax=Peribacillus butanolivorans TaxID=421767 RepID=UPI00366FF4FF